MVSTYPSQTNIHSLSPSPALIGGSPVHVSIMQLIQLLSRKSTEILLCACNMGNRKESQKVRMRGTQEHSLTKAKCCSSMSNKAEIKKLTEQ